MYSNLDLYSPQANKWNYSFGGFDGLTHLVRGFVVFVSWIKL